MDKWFNVNKDIRVWAGHSEAQKQGWIYAPAAVYIIDEYKGSGQFKPEDMKFDLNGRIEVKSDPGYSDYWVRLDELSLVPFDLDVEEEPPVGPDEPPVVAPPPSPDPSPVGEPSDEEVGRVVKYLLSLL